MSLPEDVWARIHDMVGKNYLFLAPVCKKWCNWYYTKQTKHTKYTNFIHAMASSSTIRESGESRGGKTVLSRKNAWDFLAKHVSDRKLLGEMADELSLIIDWDEFSVGTAGRHGNLSFILWLRKNNKLEWDSDLALSSSALAGQSQNLAFLKNMYNLGYIPGDRACTGAALAGSVEILRWLQDAGCDTKDVTQVLAEEGHLGPLQWANSYGFKCDRLTLDAAKYEKRLGVVRYLRAYLNE